MSNQNVQVGTIRRRAEVTQRKTRWDEHITTCSCATTPTTRPLEKADSCGEAVDSLECRTIRENCGVVSVPSTLPSLGWKLRNFHPRRVYIRIAKRKLPLGISVRANQVRHKQRPGCSRFWGHSHDLHVQTDTHTGRFAIGATTSWKTTSTPAAHAQ